MKCHLYSRPRWLNQQSKVHQTNFNVGMRLDYVGIQRSIIVRENTELHWICREYFDPILEEEAFD